MKMSKITTEGAINTDVAITGDNKHKHNDCIVETININTMTVSCETININGQSPAWVTHSSVCGDSINVHKHNDCIMETININTMTVCGAFNKHKHNDCYGDNKHKHNDCIMETININTMTVSWRQ